MAKKKMSLKPVQRGFATTSVANKKPPPQKDEPAQDSKGEDTPATVEPSSEAASATPTSNGDAPPDKLADWEDDAVLEKEALQALVDKLHDKGEKEVARVIKSIDFDRRLSASFPNLEVDESLRDRVLELALEDERTALDADSSQPPTRTFPAATSPSETEKGYLRLFVAYHVLQALGFGQARIEQCILEGLKEGGGWEEALEWMWMHLSEDECLQQGDYAKREEPSITEPQESLNDLDVPPEPETEPEPEPVPSSIPATTKNTQSSSTPAAPTSLFQALDAGASDLNSETDSDDSDSGRYQANESWAKLMLELDNMRITAGGRAGGGGKKGKKGKGPGVVLETPETRRVKEKIVKIEKEYLFTRRDADAILKVLRSQRDASAIAAKFKGVSIQDPPVPEASPAPSSEEPISSAPPPAPEPVDLFAGSDSDPDSDTGGLFGGMLNEPTPSPSLAESPSATCTANTTITVRSMPIPKQLSFAGTIPKNILKAAIAKSGKQAVIYYARLSGSSRACRAALEVRWSTGGGEGERRVWKMDDIACDDFPEAENYVSTLALHALEAEGVLAGVNWRTMPAAYRELWEELRVQRKEKEDEVKRGVWGMVKGLWERKAVEKGVEVREAKGEGNEGKGTSGVGAGEVKQEEQVDGKTGVFSAKLQADFERRRQTPAYQTMLSQRSTLPIASFRDQITSTLASHQIMVLSGETGCGKSTQLPSFILEDQLTQGRPCKIFVTEPRRISAISLAQRVSQELGDAKGVVGSERSLVGYSIRLESKVSRETRLAFVTNGIALRMLESGSGGGGGGGRGGMAFDQVTHIIVDEVHERSIESDFLLIVLKNLCLQRPELKVVLMSATVDADKISAFFGGCPCLSVPGRTFPVKVNYLEDAVQVTGWTVDEGSPYAVRGRGFKPANQLVEWNEEGAKSDSDPEDEDGDGSASAKAHPAKLPSTKYSAATVSTVNLLDSRQIPYPLIVKLLEGICFADPELTPFSAATLVFMPGLAEIRKLHDMLLAHPDFGGRGFVVWPLHSSVSSEGQSAVFDTPPAGVRKIVIATNIAETGVTIPDITCVIDSGKHREMRYDEKRQLSRFIESYIARSNAKQRRGRAGRVQPGLAFHLFTKARHDTQLAEHPIPEMLRLSLQDLALRIKILKVPLGKTVESVLLQALDPPSALNVQRAVAALVEVKALTPGEEITPLGRLLSKLPMDVHLGKFLLVAAMLGCLDPALTIAATLNSKSPFVTPFGFEAQARAAKAGFAVGKSDFLTIANVFSSWRRASDNPNYVRVFCKKNFVSQQNLQQIEELRQQLLAYLVDSSFVEATPAQRQTISQARFSRGVRTRFVTVPPELNVNGDKVKVLEAALASGLYPKLLALDSAGGMKTLINQQPVAIHPSSVNFKLPRSEFGTNYLTYFTVMHSKRLYAWETGPVDDTALVLLCGDIADFRISASSFILDRKIKYHLPPKTALALKLVREQLALAWMMRFRGKRLSEGQQKWFDLGMECLTFVPGEEKEASVGVVRV